MFCFLLIHCKNKVHTSINGCMEGWMIDSDFCTLSVRGMAFILKGPAGSVGPHRCALTQERSGAAAAVDAVPSSDHTQRGCSAPLLPHQHHDTQIQTRNLSRTEDQPAEDCVDTYPHIHTRTLARSHARTERRTSQRPAAKHTATEPKPAEEKNSTAPRILRFSLQKRVPARTPRRRRATPRESFHATTCHRRARTPTAGITPTMWDRTAWRRRWAKDRQVSKSPAAGGTRGAAAGLLRGNA